MMFGFNLVEALRGLAQGPLIRGGVHPQGHKAPTADKPINLSFPLPLKLYIPLQQHVGQPAEPAVQVGQRVRRGELLANSQGMISAPVHAPTSGIIKDVTEYPAPHPSALPIRTIILETDGEDEAPEPLRLPDLEVRVYHDAALAEASRLGAPRSHPALGPVDARLPAALDIRWRRNILLNKWLEYLADTGHAPGTFHVAD